MLRSKGNFKVPIVEWRTVINIIVKFCFVARNADVVELTRQNFTFVKDLLYIHFPKAKNDQYYEGSTTMFEATEEKRYCPVNLTLKYFDRLGYDPSSTGYFLPKLVVKGRDKKSIQVDTFPTVPVYKIGENFC